MSTGVTHGADTDRLRVIAADLSESARAVMQVQHSGTQSMGTLVESWAGSDTQAYAADWQSVLPALTSAAERLTTLARLLVEQADEQDIGSGRAGGSERGGLGSPLGRRPDGTGLDPRQALAGLSLPGLPSGSTLRDWWDRGIKMGIRNAVPTMPGLGPLLEISYERWQ